MHSPRVAGLDYLILFRIDWRHENTRHALLVNAPGKVFPAARDTSDKSSAFGDSYRAHAFQNFKGFHAGVRQTVHGRHLGFILL
jgi:hypothetical protein